MCNPAWCGFDPSGADCRTRHHKSADHFVRVGGSNIHAYRFVDFRTCIFCSRNGHMGVHGLAESVPGRNMIVSTGISWGDHRIAAAHEISHLLGARDNSCEPGARCVMRGSNFFEWCRWCIEEILSWSH